jgi:hypothetical protein
MVGVLDGASGLVLGSKKANRHGSFRLEVEPMTPPCEVQVQAGEVRSETMLVRGAPVGCGEQVQLQLRAKWECAEAEDEDDAGADARLRVGGERAPAGASIVVHDAAGGAVLGSSQADASGHFKLRIDVAAPPSAVDVVVAAGGMEWSVDAIPVRLESCDEEDEDDEEARSRDRWGARAGGCRRVRAGAGRDHRSTGNGCGPTSTGNGRGPESTGNGCGPRPGGGRIRRG